jgi:arylsulfatase A-like enzyme
MRPNIVFVFGDQWRGQACGYAGDPNVQTPHLDKFAGESVNLINAVADCPVCSPYRASLMTGQYPLTHGVFLNDVCLRTKSPAIAQVLGKAGYNTAYVGKWHLDGHGRSNFIPRERRLGFDYWKVLECTHHYNDSFYHGDEPTKLKWDGYDAIAQTRDAESYIRGYDSDRPFVLFLSWGPPHDPYETAPERYRALYQPERLTLRPNVPPASEEFAQKSLAGYYAHITAMDDCFGELRRTLRETGLEDNTILIFTSDHGDMLGSQGQTNKQQLYDESLRVPFLLRFPEGLGTEARRLDPPICSVDITPTLLGLCGLDIPDSVEGLDYSGLLRGGGSPGDDIALASCPSPFGQWRRCIGARECRGVRTKRYTYVRHLDGPWFLFDNETDPFQMENLCNCPQHKDLQADLDAALDRKLRQANDEFLSGWDYIRKWGYVTDADGTIPYRD